MNNKLKNIFYRFMLVYIGIIIIFYIIAGKQLSIKQIDSSIKQEKATHHVGEITKNSIIEQEFISSVDEITDIKLMVGTFARSNTSTLNLELKDIDDNILNTQKVKVNEVEDNKYLEIKLNQNIKNANNKKFKLIISSDDAEYNNAITIWRSDKLLEQSKLFINKEPVIGSLCMDIKGICYTSFNKWYWLLAIVLGIIFIVEWNIISRKYKRGERTLILNLIETIIKYKFLLKQLVARDFKTKYKRSVLGVVWSFLNPLLTMSVQYVVFSTLFKSDIENFPVYLLTGIICFNFFTEATGMALTSIVGNAALITKVYVPKYIYPISRVISSTINLILSLIPLLIVVLITQTKITLSILLLIFVIFNLILFTIGIGFILATLMVFFRDTQFLWGVISLLWNYMTPVFYPISIIPDKFITIYKLNPLYHFINFARIVIMQGITPDLKEYVLCMIASIVTLLIGFWIFRKNQDKFVLNI